MRKISVLILTISIVSLTGCQDEKPTTVVFPIENTTEFISQSGDKQGLKGKNPEKDLKSKQEIYSKKDTFILLDIHNRSQKISFNNERIIFQRNQKPIVLVNIFATWCAPCTAQLSYLNMLQKKYNDDLFITGLLMHDSINIPSLESFTSKHNIKYFISHSPNTNAFGKRLASTLHLEENFSIPLTIMYVEDKYFTHYEGAVPVEIIEYDIQQAQKQLKHNKN
ncbi:MAG: redoxin family protein [Sulfurovum sp.]|nr:redoxin family protein [Sulfurovum sp.]